RCWEHGNVQVLSVVAEQVLALAPSIPFHDAWGSASCDTGHPILSPARLGMGASLCAGGRPSVEGRGHVSDAGWLPVSPLHGADRPTLPRSALAAAAIGLVRRECDLSARPASLGLAS